MGIPTTTSIANWNRSTQHVEAAIRSGRYVNAETCLLFAGPPRISDIGLVSGLGIDLNNLGQSLTSPGSTGAGANGRDALYPVGLVESFGVQQAQNVQKMFEIGSRRSYQAGGRVQVVGDMGRVMFNGPSLMRALYAYYPNAISMANGKVLGRGGTDDSISTAVASASDTAAGIFPQIFFEPGAFANKDAEDTQAQSHSFFFNLMSDLFSHPFGFGFLMRDNKNQNYGAVYIEDCFITAHSFRISSSSTLITESVSFQADACVPMEFNTSSGAQIAVLGRGT
jgi:hypothetical protein